jgi:hypothetical protein
VREAYHRDDGLVCVCVSVCERDSAEGSFPRRLLGIWIHSCVSAAVSLTVSRCYRTIVFK